MTARTQGRPSKRASLWSRILRITRAEGLRGLIRHAAEYCTSKFRFLHSYLLYVDIDPNAALPEAKGSLAVERVLPDDRETITDIIKIYRVPADEPGILRRMANHELCYAGRMDGRVVGYVWIFTGTVVKEYNEKLFSLAPDEMYYHDAFVIPEMRGRNIYTVMKAVTGQALARSMGKKRAVSFIRSDNHASLNASRKLGAVRTGRIGYAMLFGRRFRYLIRERPRPL